MSSLAHRILDLCKKAERAVVSAASQLAEGNMSSQDGAGFLSPKEDGHLMTSVVSVEQVFTVVSED